MADSKLSALTELAATPASDDEVYIRDVSEAGSAESKRITVANLMDAAARSATLIVAANDSSAKSKAGADYVCDGTDDDVQIQAAIDALTSGGQVILTEGVFNVTSSITFTFNNQQLRGQGQSTNITANVGLTTSVIASDGTQRNNCRILDLQVNANSIADYGINFSKLFLVKIINVNLSGANSASIFASNTGTDSNSPYMENIYINGRGILLTNVNGIFANNVLLESAPSSTDCFTFSGGGEGMMANINISSGSARHGLVLSNTNRLQVVNLNVGAVQNHGLYITGNSKNNTFSGYWVNDIAAGGATSGSGISIVDTAHDNVITSFVLASANGYGISIGGTAVNNLIASGNAVDIDSSRRTNITSPNFNTIRNVLGITASGDVVTISKIIDHADLTDDGGATGRIDFSDTIPAGSIIKAVKLDYTEAWNSDNTSTLTIMIGYVGDLDAFNLTADPGENGFNTTTDVYWGEGDCQAHRVTTAKTPRVTFTEDDDITHIISGAGAQGKVTITITYMKA